MIVLQLTAEEADQLAFAVAESLGGGGLIAWDPTDRAVKVKQAGRWSPPLGTVIADD